MTDVHFHCPHCDKNLVVDSSGSGLTLTCPTCGKDLLVPTSESPKRTPAPSPRRKKVGETLERVSDKVEAKVGDVISSFVTEAQDPEQVGVIHASISDILTGEEEIKYIAVQNKPVVNVAPDAAVLTNRRFIVYHPKLFGRVDFDDYIWRDLLDAKLQEGVMGATLTFQTNSGRRLKLEYIPKAQARKVYAFAQEMEERVREERRAREIEEKRAAAGGVVIQGGGAGEQSLVSQTPEDPVSKLKQLKEMMDAGLITAGEYESKRQAILSRM